MKFGHDASSAAQRDTKFAQLALDTDAGQASINDRLHSIEQIFDEQHVSSVRVHTICRSTASQKGEQPS